MDDEPFSGDPTELLASIGKITVLWAKMEGILDSICTVIFFMDDGAKIEAQLPRALDRKLEFLRKSHQQLPSLEVAQSAGNKLIDTVHSLKQRRHDIVHGFADALSEDSIRLRVLKKDKRMPRGFSFDQQVITQEDLDDLFSRIGLLFELANEHFHTVMGAVFAQDPDDASGSITD